MGHFHFFLIVYVVSFVSSSQTFHCKESLEYLGLQFDEHRVLVSSPPSLHPYCTSTDSSSLAPRIGDFLSEVNGVDITRYSLKELNDLFQPHALYPPFNLSFRSPSQEDTHNTSSPLKSQVPSAALYVLEGADDASFFSHQETSSSPITISVAEFSSPLFCGYRSLMLASPIDVCSLSRQQVSSRVYSNKFVLAYRGTCSFHAKALNVMSAGGAGLIVINSQNNHFVIKSVDLFDPRAVFQNLSIPVVMIGSTDGDALILRHRKMSKTNERVDSNTRIKAQIASLADCSVPLSDSIKVFAGYSGFDFTHRLIF